MKRSDLLAMCLQNLRRRKARTMLTVLGVMIGCCSIIIMVSIGIGSKESQELMLSQMGDLNIITVNPSYGPSTGTDAKLNDEAISSFKLIPNVETVSPKDSFYDYTFKIYAGNRRYVVDWGEIAGIYPDSFEAIGYQLEEGEPFAGRAFDVVVGENFAYNFMDTMRPEGQNYVDQYQNYDWEKPEDQQVNEPPDPFLNPMVTPIELEIVIDEEKGLTLTQPLNVTGRMKEDYSKGGETSYGLLMSINDLQKLREDIRRAGGGSTTSSAAKEYQTILVKAATIQDVEEVENQIKALGFNTSSMESIRKPMEEEARQKQMMLGGLGAISLFVAALGITNTMIMSITERTREIGIMKALGCYVRDIRAVFLLEAGSIGLIGGVLGVVISLIISVGMNLVSAGAGFTGISDLLTLLLEPGSRISVIPIWLIGFAVLFSVAIGLVSGYYPANKAVQISALEAIKYE